MVRPDTASSNSKVTARRRGNPLNERTLTSESTDEQISSISNHEGFGNEINGRQSLGHLNDHDMIRDNSPSSSDIETDSNLSSDDLSDNNVIENDLLVASPNSDLEAVEVSEINPVGDGLDEDDFPSVNLNINQIDPTESAAYLMAQLQLKRNGSRKQKSRVAKRTYAKENTRKNNPLSDIESEEELQMSYTEALSTHNPSESSSGKEAEIGNRSQPDEEVVDAPEESRKDQECSGDHQSIPAPAENAEEQVINENLGADIPIEDWDSNYAVISPMQDEAITMTETDDANVNSPQEWNNDGQSPFDAHEEELVDQSLFDAPEETPETNEATETPADVISVPLAPTMSPIVLHKSPPHVDSSAEENPENSSARETPSEMENLKVPLSFRRIKGKLSNKALRLTQEKEYNVYEMVEVKNPRVKAVFHNYRRPGAHEPYSAQSAKECLKIKQLPGNWYFETYKWRQTLRNEPLYDFELKIQRRPDKNMDVIREYNRRINARRPRAKSCTLYSEDKAAHDKLLQERVNPPRPRRRRGSTGSTHSRMSKPALCRAYLHETVPPVNEYLEILVEHTYKTVYTAAIWDIVWLEYGEDFHKIRQDAAKARGENYIPPPLVRYVDYKPLTYTAEGLYKNFIPSVEPWRMDAAKRVNRMFYPSTDDVVLDTWFGTHSTALRGVPRMAEDEVKRRAFETCTALNLWLKLIDPVATSSDLTQEEIALLPPPPPPTAEELKKIEEEKKKEEEKNGKRKRKKNTDGKPTAASKKRDALRDQLIHFKRYWKREAAEPFLKAFDIGPRKYLGPLAIKDAVPKEAHLRTNSYPKSDAPPMPPEQFTQMLLNKVYAAYEDVDMIKATQKKRKAEASGGDEPAPKRPRTVNKNSDVTTTKPSSKSKKSRGKRNAARNHNSENVNEVNVSMADISQDLPEASSTFNDTSQADPPIEDSFQNDFDDTFDMEPIKIQNQPSSRVDDTFVSMNNTTSDIAEPENHTETVSTGVVPSFKEVVPDKGSTPDISTTTLDDAEIEPGIETTTGLEALATIEDNYNESVSSPKEIASDKSVSPSMSPINEDNPEMEHQIETVSEEEASTAGGPEDVDTVATKGSPIMDSTDSTFQKSPSSATEQPSNEYAERSPSIEAIRLTPTPEELTDAPEYSEVWDHHTNKQNFSTEQSATLSTEKSPSGTSDIPEAFLSCHSTSRVQEASHSPPAPSFQESPHPSDDREPSLPPPPASVVQEVSSSPPSASTFQKPLFSSPSASHLQEAASSALPPSSDVPQASQILLSAPIPVIEPAKEKEVTQEVPQGSSLSVIPPKKHRNKRSTNDTTVEIRSKKTKGQSAQPVSYSESTPTVPPLSSTRSPEELLKLWKQCSRENRVVSPHFTTSFTQIINDEELRSNNFAYHSFDGNEVIIYRQAEATKYFLAVLEGKKVWEVYKYDITTDKWSRVVGIYRQQEIKFDIPLSTHSRRIYNFVFKTKKDQKGKRVIIYKHTLGTVFDEAGKASELNCYVGCFKENLCLYHDKINEMVLDPRYSPFMRFIKFVGLNKRSKKVGIGYYNYVFNRIEPPKVLNPLLIRNNRFWYKLEDESRDLPRLNTSEHRKALKQLSEKLEAKSLDYHIEKFWEKLIKKNF